MAKQQGLEQEYMHIDDSGNEFVINREGMDQ